MPSRKSHRVFGSGAAREVRYGRASGWFALARQNPRAVFKGRSNVAPNGIQTRQLNDRALQFLVNRAGRSRKHRI